MPRWKNYRGKEGQTQVFGERTAFASAARAEEYSAAGEPADAAPAGPESGGWAIPDTPVPMAGSLETGEGGPEPRAAGHGRKGKRRDRLFAPGRGSCEPEL